MKSDHRQVSIAYLDKYGFNMFDNEYFKKKITKVMRGVFISVNIVCATILTLKILSSRTINIGLFVNIIYLFLVVYMMLGLIFLFLGKDLLFVSSADENARIKYIKGFHNGKEIASVHHINEHGFQLKYRNRNFNMSYENIMRITIAQNYIIIIFKRPHILLVLEKNETMNNHKIVDWNTFIQYCLVRSQCPHRVDNEINIVEENVIKEKYFKKQSLLWNIKSNIASFVLLSNLMIFVYCMILFLIWIFSF